MPIQTDEQIKDIYLPKLQRFMDERLTAENAKRIYDFLQPYQYDTGGWILHDAAKEILNTDVYSEFPAEDNLGYFEILDGNGLLKWLEIAKFADKEYERLRGGYELLRSHTLDTNSPKYQDYQSALWTKAVKNIINRLVDKQPYLLDGFWSRLSYIENILGKGFPTRDILNEKIASEAKEVFAAASTDDLTGFHSEVEIKHQIRNELRDISMTDEMIQALYITDNVLDDAYRSYLESDKGDQVFLAVFDYLEKAEHDYLSDRLYDRVTLEYQDYLDTVKEKTKDQIIDEAYKITTLYDLQCSLDPYTTSNFSTERLKALMSLSSPLWSIYDEWQNCDSSTLYDMKDTIVDMADRIQDANCEIDPDPFGFEAQEDEDEQER